MSKIERPKAINSGRTKIRTTGAGEMHRGFRTPQWPFLLCRAVAADTPHRGPVAVPTCGARAHLGPAAEAIASRIQCAPALAAQSVLAVGSLAAQRLADVHLPFGQTRPLSLFVVTLAGSGDRKSSADNEALIPVRMAKLALREEYRSAFERWKITAAVWEAERKKIEADRKFDRAQREAALTKLGQARQNLSDQSWSRRTRQSRASPSFGTRCPGRWTVLCRRRPDDRRSRLWAGPQTQDRSGAQRAFGMAAASAASAPATVSPIFPVAASPYIFSFNPTRARPSCPIRPFATRASCRVF